MEKLGVLGMRDRKRMSLRFCERDKDDHQAHTFLGHNKPPRALQQRCLKYNTLDQARSLLIPRILGNDNKRAGSKFLYPPLASTSSHGM